MYKISKQGGRGGGITYLAFLAYEDYVNLNLMLIMFRINYSIITVCIFYLHSCISRRLISRLLSFWYWIDNSTTAAQTVLASSTVSLLRQV